MIILKTKEDLKKMKTAGKLVAQVLDYLSERVKPGVSTLQLDNWAEEQCKLHGAIPVFKNYPHHRGEAPFPGSICASINAEVVHGIPSGRKLNDGDIISIDFGVSLNGFVGDSAVTIPVGSVKPQDLNLIRVTEEALLRGIKEARIGNRLGNVSNAIQTFVEKHGYSVVRAYAGHGIGREMHEDPSIPNYGRIDSGPYLKAGMTLAIEPMVNAGSHRVVTKSDKWTVVTLDGSNSAHFEHTIAITDDGPEILTVI